MDIVKILQVTGIVVAGLSAIAGVVGYIVIGYKKASKEKMDGVVSSSDQLTGFWKEQVDGFKEIVATQTEKVRTLTGEIGELRGQLNEKTKQAEEYKLIFQGQNPEMKQFMETMLAVSKQSQEYMAEDKKFKTDQHDILVALLQHLAPNAVPSLTPSLKIEGTISKQ